MSARTESVAAFDEEALQTGKPCQPSIKQIIKMRYGMSSSLAAIKSEVANSCEVKEPKLPQQKHFSFSHERSSLQTKDVNAGGYGLAIFVSCIPFNGMPSRRSGAIP